VDDAGYATRLERPPERVVSLIPATTELLFALGEGGRLVGRTSWCDYPAEAAGVPDLGNGIDFNVEAVLAARPGLVLVYRSGAHRAGVERLRGLGVPVFELATDRMGDLARTARLVGRALGIEARADSLVGALDRDLQSATVSPSGPVRPSVFLLSWDRPVITLGQGSFLSELVERAGGRNLFADLTTPSAQVSIEAVAARDPDFILVSGTGEPSIAGRPEWRAVRAVRERRFVRVEGSAFNRPSPRAADAVRQLAAALRGAAR
jgi:iron complex transport system substrate-binding protein